MNTTPAKTGPLGLPTAQPDPNPSEPAPDARLNDYATIYLGTTDKEAKTWHILRRWQRRRMSTIVNSSAEFEGAVRRMEDFGLDDSS